MQFFEEYESKCIFIQALCTIMAPKGDAECYQSITTFGRVSNCKYSKKLIPFTSYKACVNEIVVQNEVNTCESKLEYASDIFNPKQSFLFYT